MSLTEGFPTRSLVAKLGSYCVGPPRQGHLEKRKKQKRLSALAVLKFNPYHSTEDGKFTSGPSGSKGGGGGSVVSTGSMRRRTPRHLSPAQRAMQADFARRSRKKIHEVNTPEEGVALILKGENVLLKDTKHVHTILSKLGEMAIKAKEKGEKAPNFDPCQITVKGTSLFCSEKVQTKEFPHGIPRIEMPQFKSKNPVPGSEADKLPRDKNGEVDATDAFLKHLDSLGVDTNSYDTEKARKLKASQGEMEGAKVAGMMVSKERDPKKARIVISGDNYVVDGHHTWAASVGRDAEDGNLDNDKEMDVVRIGLPMSEIYHLSVTWTKKFGLPAAAVKKQERWIYVYKFDPNQPRDEEGQWTRTGGTPKPGSLSFGTGSTPESRATAKAKVTEIKEQIVRINDQLLDHVTNDTMESPEAKGLLENLKSYQKQMFRLDSDPGGWGSESIGQPGGPRDVVIVGAGPGGLSAAINGGTEGLDTLFIDANLQVGGQAKFSSRIENFAGFPGGVSGKKLANSLHEQAQRVGAEGMLGVRAVGLEHDPATGLKTLTLSNGQKIVARSVILAGGLEFKKIKFPGSDAQGVTTGDGEQLTKDGKDGHVIVVGGANSASQAALGAAKKAKSVTILSRSPIVNSMSASQVDAVMNHPKIKVITGDQIASVQTDAEGRATGVTLQSGNQLPAQAVGIFVGSGPTTSWLPSDIKRTDGKIHVNKDLETDIPGVFAVGDVRAAGESGRTLGRVGAAVGEGQVAIANVFQYFERQKRSLAHKSESPRRARAHRLKQAEAPRWDGHVDAAFALDEQFPYFSQVEDRPYSERFVGILRGF